jgi:hypothetical protein
MSGEKSTTEKNEIGQGIEATWGCHFIWGIVHGLTNSEAI